MGDWLGSKGADRMKSDQLAVRPLSNGTRPAHQDERRVARDRISKDQYE